jgi:polysaccharide pyruvyl transferase WcaK-like protein
MVMRVLHVASFKGNIGDNASHKGFYNVLKKVLPNIVEIEQMEIRSYYKNSPPEERRFFDESFVNHANKFDLLVFGGGGFLDYWVSPSETGTTIDISIEQLSQINTPILISSVGCTPNKIVPVENKIKFERFLNYVLSSKNISLLLRNDGSVQHLEREFGKELASSVTMILDNGFHYVPEVAFQIPTQRKYVAINVSYDQSNMRGPESACIDTNVYYNELAKTVEHIIKLQGLDVCFVPHIHEDYKAIAQITSLLEDFLVRNHIAIAPYFQGGGAEDFIFSIYRNSELIVGTRYHTNVCGTAMGVKTIGLPLLNRIKHMYDSIDMSESYVILQDGFSTLLIQKIDSLLSEDVDEYRREVLEKLSVQKAISINHYKAAINKLIN